MSPSEPRGPDSGWTARGLALARRFRDATLAVPATPVFAGIVLGFGLCCAAGRVVSQRPLFDHFLRFHGPISPQGQFYPTASELVAQVRATVPRSKYLVLVGGASYFRGSGQNPDDLWTRELQRLLGDDYAVVNFAMDNGGVTSFAAVAFQILARDYPRIAYVCNASPVVADPVDGGILYRYVFWDAYYKGLLSMPFPWSEGVRTLARDERKDRGGLELHLGKWIDHYTYASDLWTTIGYRYGFTVWSDLSPQAMTTARRNFIERVIPNFADRQRIYRENPKNVRENEAGNRDFSTKGFTRNASGAWERDPWAWEIISQLSATMFPYGLRSKCYLVFLRANPFFMKSFTSDDWKRHNELYRLGEQAFSSNGYHIIQLPDADLTPDDYADGGHFLASGGRKIARAVASRLLADRPPAGSSGP
ncbi:MAG TPA: hypothetical protein VGF85_04675 [Opitutaceae bacterium]|jgi:hypothetical protein